MTDGRRRRRPDVSTRVVADETLVLDRRANRIHQLNATASVVWRCCDGQHTEQAIADALVAAYEVDADTARAAVAQALRQLEALDLLEVDPQPSATR